MYQVLFYAAAALTIASAVVVIAQKNPFYSAFALIVNQHLIRPEAQF